MESRHLRTSTPVVALRRGAFRHVLLAATHPGCLGGVVLFLLLGWLALIAINLAFAPWIYIVGGHTRWIPVWAGTGVIEAPSGPFRGLPVVFTIE